MPVFPDLLRPLVILSGAWILPFLSVAAFAEEATVPVTFEVNDAFVKDKALPGVAIELARTKEGAVERSGVTGADGRLAMAVTAGTWFVTYRLKDYVPIVRSETEIRADTRVVTTSLSMNMESEGKAGDRRVRIVLNWGSRQDQVRDADAHVLCPCSKRGAHVFFENMRHQEGDHEASLDVDDTNWGGPETITLLHPIAGEYRYFVHNYSGDPARIGASEIVVRVLVDDAQVGEFRPPADVDQMDWSPFRLLRISDAGIVSIVPFTEAELAKGEDRRSPALPESESLPDDSGGQPPAPSGPLVGVFIAGFLVVGFFVWVVRRARKQP